MKKIGKTLAWILAVILIVFALMCFIASETPVGVVSLILGILLVKHLKKPKNQRPKFKAVYSKPATSDPVSFPVSAPKEDTQPKETDEKTETHRVAGIAYRVQNVEELGTENEDYNASKRYLIEQGTVNERIYEYFFCTLKTELIPEPDNPHDPNAIKVVVDGVHIGYIKSGSTSHVKKLMDADAIKKIETEIYGGKYKVIWENDDEEYEMERDKTDYAAKVTLYIKQ